MMELASKYSPAEVEGKWYEYWEQHKLFASKPDGREPYTIVIPPPNVTGVLHMGHMLNNTIQDILIRKARMDGKNACWAPGTDHASIATEAKVVNKLAEEGIKKRDLTREQFLEHAWNWTHEYGGIILKQLRKLGASCDWDRTAFTMDEKRSESVLKVFVDLYRKGLIYRGLRMVNWDPKAQTVLSTEEVIYKEEQSKLYYLKYRVCPLNSPRGGASSSEQVIDRYQTADPALYDILKNNAKANRKFSTEAESAMWEMLRGNQLGVKFRRQHVIADFIVDFVTLEHQLVIEIDGGYHLEEQQKRADEMRTNILKDLGYEVLRFTNDDVMKHPEDVLHCIRQEIAYLRYVQGKSSPSGGVEGADAEVPYAVVATTRPETIMGDTAMCINPKDPKNQWLRGRKVIVPLVNRVIPVIEDRYVDIEFGTGCLKVTPAHDVNDYNLGKTHNLETIDIFNPDGTISEQSPLYVGMDRFDVRKQIAKDLEEAGLLEKVEDYVNKVGYSERNSDTAVEPRLCMQWFLSMRHFADIALPPVKNGELKFYPTKYVTTYVNWLENIQDWCISRQLWWGHRIPAYFLPKPHPLTPSPKGEGEACGGEEERFVVALTPEEALKEAQKLPGYENITLADLRRDEDALDTWFSSWLWPISLFDGINKPGNEEINYYYPTSVLVTAPDIIFFWVARMIMAGYEYLGEMPFKSVYFTGVVRDKLGRKMSKSLGNSPDPLLLIDQYGADGVRMGMLLSAPAGNDILFDEKLCQNGLAFCNKIWNAFRLVQGWEQADIPQPEASKKAIAWFDAQLKAAYAEIEDHYKKFRLSDALMSVFKLFTDEFSGWYLEMIKPAYQQPIDKATYAETLRFFDILMKLVHPFMPFITEELWQHIYERKDGDSIMTESLHMEPTTKDEEKLLADIAVMKQIVAGVRAVRNAKNIAPKEQLELEIVGKNPVDSLSDLIVKMANLSGIRIVETKGEGSSAFLVGTTECAVPLGNLIDTEVELQKMEAELKHLEGFLISVQKKLSNERFVANAPAQVVELERKKQSDAETKIAALKENIAKLK